MSYSTQCRTENRSNVAVDDSQIPRVRSGQELDNAPDDRYPGSFFRVPGIPRPGKTAWSLVE